MYEEAKQEASERVVFLYALARPQELVADGEEGMAYIQGIEELGVDGSVKDYEAEESGAENGV